jgi:hypothetical protein
MPNRPIRCAPRRPIQGVSMDHTRGRGRLVHLYSVGLSSGLLGNACSGVTRKRSTAGGQTNSGVPRKRPTWGGGADKFRVA